MADSEQTSQPGGQQSGRPAWRKWLLLAVVATVMAGAGYAFRDQLTLEQLARREAQLQGFRDRRPVLVYSAAFVAYVLVTGLSIPGATVLTLLYGQLFGLAAGVLLVSFASTAGATLAFLFSRYVLRDLIRRRFSQQLERFDAALREEGPFYLFTLRLIPAAPFFVINAVMGLTSLATVTFWWVSQLGMFPGTCVYVAAGASVPDLQVLAERGVRGILKPSLLIAFAALGLFPLVVRRLMRRWRAAESPAESGEGPS